MGASRHWCRHRGGGERHERWSVSGVPFRGRGVDVAVRVDLESVSGGGAGGFPFLFYFIYFPFLPFSIQKKVKWLGIRIGQGGEGGVFFRAHNKFLYLYRSKPFNSRDVLTTK